MAESIQQKLFDAAYALNLSAVKKHLKAGASLKKGDKDGCDVLYHAISSMGQGSDAEVQKKQKALVEFLVSQGADLNKQYKFLSGWTPVIMAASGGQIAALEVLLQAGADFEKTDDYKFTALMRAALNGQAAAVKQLLEKGAEVLKKNGSKADALKLALEGKKEDSGQTGADYGATIALLKKFGAKPAEKATEQKHAGGKKPEKSKAPEKPALSAPSKTLKAMQKHFAPHSVPVLLAELCNYWDKHPVFFSGSFEVDEDKYDSVKDWFQGHEAGWSQVKVFGVDGIHSLYGLWLYDGIAAEKAPVIYLGGEGEGTTLLATDMRDLLALLAANREWEPFDKKFMDAEESNDEENAAFRNWLKEKFAITPAKNPLAILQKARKEHPDLNKWLASVIPGWE